MKEIILDTETTGLDPREGHRVIEIGALEMHDKVLTGRKFHCYLNPERDVPDVAYRIHGLSTEFLVDKPLFHTLADSFLEFISGASLVIHNASFDLKFLNSELSKAAKQSIDHLQVVDTLLIARKLFPGSKASLDALCKRFKIDNSARTFHGALKDAQLLAEVYIELCGGRQSSLDIAKPVQNIGNIASFVTVSANQKQQLKIVTPNKAELAAHQELMAKLTVKPI